MGDDVLRGEVTGRAELVLQLLQEVEVEVHELVGGTVERPRLRRRPAAAGVDGSTEEHRVGAGERTLERLRVLLLPVERHVVDRTAHDLFDVGLAGNLTAGVAATGLLGRAVRQGVRRCVGAVSAEQLREQHDRGDDEQPDDAAAGLHRDRETASAEAGAGSAGPAPVAHSSGSGGSNLGHETDSFLPR